MRKRRELAQPSDIAFLLIIFFLLLAGVGASRALPLVIASSGGEEGPHRHLTVTLREDGTLLTSGSVIDEEKVAALLSPGIRITLLIEPRTRWQQVVHTLSLATDVPSASVTLEELP